MSKQTGAGSTCRCGHVRNSHRRDGPCKWQEMCRCSAWRPAYPTFSKLPEGVEWLKDFRSGLTLVQCLHVERNEVGVCQFCKADAREERPVKRLVVYLHLAETLMAGKR